MVKKKRRLHEEMLKEMLRLGTSSFGLVAALAWNQVIQELVGNPHKAILW